MRVKILETGEVKRLSIIDLKSGVNWVQDLIGNTGALQDGQFTWSEEDNAYLASQDTYDWWNKYITGWEETEAEIHWVAERYSLAKEEIHQRLAAEYSEDYDTHRSSAQRVLAEIEEEQQAEEE